MAELSEVGRRVVWHTADGQRHAGLVVEMDSNVAIVRCDDGQTRCIEDGDKLLAAAEGKGADVE